MAIAALVLYLVYLVLCFGVRAVVLRLRTGDTGFRGISGERGSSRWWAGAIFGPAIILGVLGPVSDLVGVPPMSLLTHPALQITAAGVALFGIALTVLTQSAMGDSWRIGVDDTERTKLVINGPFAVVRNPIFSAMLLTGAGLALMAPNAVSLAGWLALFVAVNLQVRLVEEPYLLDTHTDAYVAYASRTGRFLPRIGRSRNTYQRRLSHEHRNRP
ncbi:MAG: isoprenylcysteine carboxyl methyltransferase [Cryobacterium sp.]|jgi:protein-S-isoprenylcysteine O-methyltransferase Ste14|nr:isoprenylcysteine carboxyl methyltransferase [Cryobacterium sp.]